LREAELRETHEGLRPEYSRVALASYFVELIELVMEPEHAGAGVVRLTLRRALRFLSRHPADRRAMEHFENELARPAWNRESLKSTFGPIAIGRVYHHLPKSRPEMNRLLKSQGKESA
jgi:DNA repair protein RecO (recombination protein O)